MALNLPNKLTAGDSLEFTDAVADYSAADSWVLKYTLADATNAYTITSAADGDSHKFDIAAATTALWAVGKYKWQAYAEKGAERFTAGYGWIEILPNIAAGAVDARHHVEKVLDAIEATLEGKASLDQQSMSINGRSLTRMAPGDLLAWRDKYRAELRSIRRAERLEQGLGSGSKILVRF